jgi:hypothetical protein
VKSFSRVIKKASHQEQKQKISKKGLTKPAFYDRMLKV